MNEVTNNSKKKVVIIVIIALIFVLIIGIFLLLKSNSNEDTVPVQMVKILTTDLANVNSRYTGIVVNDNATGVNKDEGREIKIIYVSVGQKVKKGTILFSYNVDEINTKIKEENLLLKKMKESISKNNKEIKILKNEREDTRKDNYDELTLEIRSLENENKQTEYDIKIKKVEIEKLNNSLKEVNVKSPVNGIIKSIKNDNSYDNNNEENNYFITIMKNGKYKVKGTINETNIRSISLKDKVKLISRIDSNKTWSGTISKIDTNTNEKKNNNGYYSDDSDSKSSSYPFYITLDDAEGLMLGQHVYIDICENTLRENGLWISSNFIENKDEKYYVWISDSKDRLTRKEIFILKYDEENDEYLIEKGLSNDDYIAIPNDFLKEGVKVTKYDNIDDYYEALSKIEEDNTNNIEDNFDYTNDFQDEVHAYE